MFHNTCLMFLHLFRSWLEKLTKMEMVALLSMSLFGSWQGINYLLKGEWLISLHIRSNLREIHDGEIEEEIREAFRVFDREGHGFITVPDLTEVLQKLGEKLSMEECQVVLKENNLIFIHFMLQELIWGTLFYTCMWEVPDIHIIDKWYSKFFWFRSQPKP
jgi:hypothetical protein